MKRLALFLLVGWAATGGVAGGSPPVADCAKSATLYIAPAMGGHWVAPCRGTVTAHVRVNSHDLVMASLSNHNYTATFYGRGSVVRLDQRHHRAYVLALTTLRRARVRVWFTP